MSLIDNKFEISMIFPRFPVRICFAPKSVCHHTRASYYFIARNIICLDVYAFCMQFHVNPFQALHSQGFIYFQTEMERR